MLAGEVQLAKLGSGGIEPHDPVLRVAQVDGKEAVAASLHPLQDVIPFRDQLRPVAGAASLHRG